MAIDLHLLADKLKRYREQFQVNISELSSSTGIEIERLISMENAEIEPTGDEILILADFYKCDYRFFISNQKLASFEQTEYLFRKYGDDLTKEDRWSIQEVMFLSECEAFLLRHFDNYKNQDFYYEKTGTFFKQHAIDAAARLRDFLGYSNYEVPMDIYEDFRKIGIHLFRRKLINTSISGICIKHPVAGKCVLVNYDEDIYRQRFTTAHEVGHSLLDDDNDVIVSYKKWGKSDLIEIRANTFASNYLLPPSFLKKIPEPLNWNEKKVIEWANKLKVSTEALAYALLDARLIQAEMVELIKSVRVPREDKIDPELPMSLSEKGRERKRTLLERGLSSKYVNLCIEAYRREIISAARMAEMLLVEEFELALILQLYGEEIRYGG